MNILITGGAGFIGRNLFEQLYKKYTIYAPSKEELDLLNHEAVEEFVRSKKINTIIHTAIRGGDVVLEQTLHMFMSLLRVAKYVDKIIHFGSGAEYAKTRDLVKVKETEFGGYIPEDPYGLAKYTIHQIIEREKKIVNLRLFGVYGKYEDYRFTFISNAIIKNLLQQPIRIKQNVIFDYIYVDDLVRIVDFFINHKQEYNAYNITPYKSIDLKNIAVIINKISPSPSKVFIEYKGYNKQYTGNNHRLKKLMQNFSFTSYEKGIEHLFDYYQRIVDKLEVSDIMRDEYYKNVKTINKK